MHNVLMPSILLLTVILNVLMLSVLILSIHMLSAFMLSVLMLSVFMQWKGSNYKQCTRWQHVSQLKASAFCIWYNKLWWFKTQQFNLGTGTAILWVTEPRCIMLSVVILNAVFSLLC
jgi:hypothetical protein